MSTSLLLKVHPITFLPPPGDGEAVILDSICIKANDSQLIKDNAQQGCDNSPTYNIVEQPKNISGRVEAAVGQLHGDPPATMELQPFDPRTLPPNTASSSNIATAGDADGSESNTQFGSFFHYKYNRQKSTPTDTSLPGEIPVSATTKSNQLAVTGHSHVIAAVPLPDQLTPEASRVPPTSDSKFGRTNLNYLKQRLQHKKEVTQVWDQTGSAGAHSHSSSDYVIDEVLLQMLQGSSDSTNKSTFGRSDLTSLRNKLEKTKEREKNVVAAGGVSKASDYYNLSEVSCYISDNPMMVNNLPDKKPKAIPRTKVPATNNSHSPLSKVYFKLWQCAHCQTVNEAHHNFCMHCKLPRGRQADRSALCEFCQLMIFIPARGEATEICCPRCEQVFESAC